MTASKPKRQPFEKRTIYLVNGQVQQALISLIVNLPLDPSNPLEVRISEKTKVRTPDQNSRMWAGPLKDMAEQAYIVGRSFSAEVWHEHFKREHLPEDDDPELERMVKNPETWRKWDYTPSGERVCIGSTTDLTTYGMSVYLEKMYADGANLGVMFSASPKERIAA